MIKLRKIISGTMSVILVITSILTFSLKNNITVFAAAPPQISSEGAALYNATTGEFIYEKNGDQQFYPASITKIMTALLTLEKANLDDTVVFSRSATTGLESGAVTLGVRAGDRVSVRDALYGMMLKSANEVANGLAEHVGGSVQGFAAMMNARAGELGAKNTNFVNPSGLNNRNHVTTAKDMALIAAEAFRNPTFRSLVGTTTYTFPATAGKPSPTVIGMGHKMIYIGDYRYYPGIIGGKTGYTRSAGNTLVTGAERNGIRLIAVVLKSPSSHYSDTRALLDYGFEIANSKTAEVIIKDNSVTSTSAPTRTDNKELKVESVVVQVEGAAPVVSKTLGQTQSAENTPYGPGMDIKPGWQTIEGRWIYIKDDKSKAKNEILDINGKRYWFDLDEYMAIGWRQDVGGAWYYMENSGAMNLSSWVRYNGLWYYLGSDGKMLTNTTTPDGYYVNGDGVWIS